MASQCFTCIRTDIKEINAKLELTITEGLGYSYTVKDVADEYGINYRGLLRHHQRHYLKNRSSVNQEVAQRQAVIEQAKSVIGQASDVTMDDLMSDLDISRSGLLDALNRAIDQGDDRAVRELSGAIRATTAARAKLGGMDAKDIVHVCAELPPAQESPEFLELISKILAPLFKHADAYADVVNVLEKEAGYINATTTN